MLMVSAESGPYVKGSGTTPNWVGRVRPLLREQVRLANLLRGQVRLANAEAESAPLNRGGRVWPLCPGFQYNANLTAKLGRQSPAPMLVVSAESCPYVKGVKGDRRDSKLGRQSLAPMLMVAAESCPSDPGFNTPPNWGGRVRPLCERLLRAHPDTSRYTQHAITTSTSTSTSSWPLCSWCAEHEARVSGFARKKEINMKLPQQRKAKGVTDSGRATLRC